MKKILITGGAGFIGANLIRKLVVTPNYDVFVIERKGVNLWRIKDVADKIKINFVNLENFEKLSEIISKIKPDFIFHLASYGVYSGFQKDINEMVKSNIIGTLNLASAVKSCKTSCLINASTCFVYKEKKSKLREDDALHPWNHYAITKLAAEMMLQKISEADNLSVINLRLFTPFGCFEDSQRLIPHIILNALKDQEIDLFSPDSVRDFIFIDDLVDLFLKIISNKKISGYRGEIFNVGSGKQYKVKEIVLMIEDLLNKKLKVIYSGKVNYKEPKNFVADIEKIKKAFNWKIRCDIKSGVAKDIKWFKNNFKLYEG